MDIWLNENWGRGYTRLECLKGHLMLLLPGPFGTLLCQIIQRSSYLGKALNEATVEVNKSKERLKLLNCLRSRPASYSFNLDRVHFNAVLGNDESQEFNLLRFKCAFFWLEIKIVILQNLKDSTGDLLQFLLRLGENENVVHVDHHNSFIYEFLEDVVHHCLEGCWTVAETKKHDEWFKGSTVSAESGLPFIAFTNTDVVVPPTHIQLGEILCTL